MQILILVTVWPEPESSAAGWRVQNVVDCFRIEGWKVTVASPSVPNEFSERLARSGVQVHPVALNDSSFDSWIAESRFEIAILDRFIIEEQFGWRITEFSPNTLRILDTEDLHFLRRARQAALQNGTPLENIFNADIPLQTEVALREIASIYRSDLTLILSDFEYRLLVEKFGTPEELLAIFRFCYKDFPQTPDFEKRTNFVSIGNFRHPPNADAVLWMKKEIWPKILKKLRLAGASAELHIYGAYPSREMMDLMTPEEGFIVKGPALNAHETLLKYRVNLAPLRFGAGIKGKIADGWRAGVPVVTTPIGSEGMQLEGGVFGGLVAGDADQSADAAVELYLKQEKWQDARLKADRIIHAQYDFSKNSREFLSLVKSAEKKLSLRREKNFIGQMLTHQTMRSTKYFSKWIELKEQKSNDRPKSS